MSGLCGNGSGKLNYENKAFLVQRLAVFDSPKQAAESLREEFGVSISPQGAEAYDPYKRAGRRLSQRWRDLFDTTRDQFLRNLEEIPQSHRTVRVSQLARAAVALERQGRYLAMANVLEQIAKEVGGFYIR